MRDSWCCWSVAADTSCCNCGVLLPTNVAASKTWFCSVCTCAKTEARGTATAGAAIEGRATGTAGAAGAAEIADGGVTTACAGVGVGAGVAAAGVACAGVAGAGAGVAATAAATGGGVVIGATSGVATAALAPIPLVALMS